MSVGANGGWFDSENLTYKVVRYPDSVTLHENLNNTYFTDKTITELHGYYYKITAVTSAGEGIPTNTNAVVSGPAIDTLPYNGDFSSTNGLNLWTTSDKTDLHSLIKSMETEPTLGVISPLKF